MNIAIITGASKGLGEEFVKQLAVGQKYDEIWAIARSKEKLEQLAALSKLIKVHAFDVTSESFCDEFESLLKEKDADVRLLVNNAGYGDLGNFDECDISTQAGMVELNNISLLKITHIALKYMHENAEIINISSIASFVPNQRMSVYCSTKAFVTSFSLTLRAELKARKIKVTAVCPGPMSTNFLEVANINGNSKAFDKLPRCNVSKVVTKSLVAVSKNKPLYTPRFFYKLYRFLSKVLPVTLLMKFSKT